MRRSSTTKERRTNKSSAKFERLKNFKDIQECTEYKREVSKGNLFSFITKKQKIEDKDNKKSEGKPRRSVKNKAGSNDLSITQHVVSKSVGSIVPSEKSKKTNRDSCHTLVKRSSSATESTNINMKNSNNRIMFMRKTHSLNQRTPTDIKSSIFIRPTEFIGKRLLMSSISESNSSVSGRDELGGNTKSSDDDQPVTKTKKINISSIDVNNENDRLFKSQMKRFLMNLPKCKSSTVKIEEAFTWLSRYMDYIIIRKYNASYFASKEKNYLSNFFSESVIIRIIHHAAMIFESEPTLLELSIPNSMKEINVVSDIHGSMEDLMRAFGTCGTPGDSMYLFLGDYVDRGEYEVDIVMLLFLLKICYPKYIYLLRGNHEFYDINHRNQFPSHCRQSFSSGNYWKLLNFVFNRLSLAAIIENEIYCVHGGISQWITSRNSIKNLKKPYTDNVLLVERLIITDTVWSDPSPDLSERMFPASSRNVGFCFTKNGLKKVLKLLDVKMLLRGHQQPIDGFANEFGGICCTLHSRQLDITSNASTVKVFRDKKLNDTKSMTHRRMYDMKMRIEATKDKYFKESDNYKRNLFLNSKCHDKAIDPSDKIHNKCIYCTKIDYYEKEICSRRKIYINNNQIYGFMVRRGFFKIKKLRKNVQIKDDEDLVNYCVNFFPVFFDFISLNVQRNDCMLTNSEKKYLEILVKEYNKKGIEIIRTNYWLFKHLPYQYYYENVQFERDYKIAGSYYSCQSSETDISMDKNIVSIRGDITGSQEESS